MTTQWNTRPINGTEAHEDSVSDFVVLLLRGKNTFGDRIYSYLKVSTADLRRMQLAVSSGEQFNPSDYGSVVAAGKGEPPAEVIQEIESSYKVLANGSQQPAKPVEAAPAAKGWDEF